MNAGEVHQMSDDELNVEVERLRKHLYETRCAAVTEKLENPKQLLQTRRDIARVLTERQARLRQNQRTAS